MGKTYIGVNNKARQVKKMYIGVNGIAREVKKAYVGVNGVARLIYSAEPDRHYLYNEGDECTSLTGGWTYYPQNGWVKGSNDLYITGKTGAGYYLATQNNIDYTGFSKIIVEYSAKFTSYNTYLRLERMVDQYTPSSSSFILKQHECDGDFTGEITSSYYLTNGYKLGISAQLGVATDVVRIKKIWLE